jgi:hypothetical protein
MPANHRPKWAPLFYRVVDNRLNDWHRRQNVRARWIDRFRVASDDGADDAREAMVQSADPGPLRRLAGSEAGQALDAALTALPRRQRQAFPVAPVGRSRRRSDGCSDGLQRRQCEDPSVTRVGRVAASAEGAPMNEPEHDTAADAAWIADARALLDESTAALDAATLSRLNRARQAALARQRTRGHRVWWLSAAGVAATAVLLVALVPWHARAPGALTDPAGPEGTAAIGDAVTADDIEFFEDLEFYAWLDAQDPEIDG